MVLATLLAGCTAELTDNNGGGGGGNNPPPINRFTELANTFNDAAESELATLTVSLPGLPLSFPAIAGCPTVSNTTDDDGDGIPDDATYTFANPPCLWPNFHTGSLAVSGTVRIQDSSQTTDSAYALTFTNLTWIFADTSADSLTYTAVRNGKRSRAGSDSAITLAVTDTVKRTRPQITAIATISKDLLWNFVATTPGDIEVDQPLPEGIITVTGTFHWKRSTEDWTLTVATPTPLVYDPTCTTTAQRITSGQVTLTGTISGTAGTLRITWSECGTLPTRTFIPS
jgi:hypothetical protein